MTVTRRRLDGKIRRLFPELSSDAVALGVTRDGAGPDWLVTMRMGDEDLSTHIDARQARRCLDDGQCLHLGVQLGRFVDNFCLRHTACPV